MDKIVLVGRAGADLSTSAGLVVYRDSGDSYNLKLCTDPRNALIAGILLNNDQGDDYPARFTAEGIQEMIAGGTINVGQLVACNASSHAVVATGGARIIGKCIGVSNDAYTAAAASGNKIQVLLFGDKTQQVPMVGSKTHDFGSINSGEAATTTLTVTGALTTDRADVNPNAALATATTLGLSLYAYVSAADTVTIVCTNPTAGALNLASNTFLVSVTPST
jgi:preprotein translocase subunit Sec61beta